MEDKTTIQISDINWRILTQMKLDRDIETYDDLISQLIREESITKPQETK